MTQAYDQREISASSVTELGAEDFDAIARFAKDAFGLHLPQSKREMVFARLIKRLRAVGISRFSSYLAYIQQSENAVERGEFLSSLTTNVTQFFREAHHFEFLRQTALPKLIEVAQAKGRVRLWSAGCSAGQEAYSMAMVVLATCPDASKLDIKILATDIDTKILQRAQAGVYPADEVTAIPEAFRAQAIKMNKDGSFSISETVRNLVTFAELNLIDDWPMQGKFDAIFCRNVAIYFDQPTQARLWSRFCDKITDNGHLFIGHSERISGPALQHLKSVGVTVYAKNSKLS